MKMAWNIESIPHDDFSSFFRNFADQNLPSSIASLAAQLLYQSDRLLALRKHEHIEHNTFSLLNYNEAEKIVENWTSLLIKAEELYSGIKATERAAFFELVLHPIKASFIFVKLRVSQAKNRLYGLQRRNTTNKMAQEVLDLFDADFDLSEEYHSLLNGKWNHMLRQPHYGYRETWHAPSRDMIDGLCYVQIRQNSNPIVGNMGISVEGTPGIRPGLTNEESDRTHPSRGDLKPGLTLPCFETYGRNLHYFEIFRRGTTSFSWNVSTPYAWIKASPASGILDDEMNQIRIYVEVDWSSVPEGFDQIEYILVSSSVGDYEHVHMPIIRRSLLVDSFKGYVESEGYVSIPATRPTRDIKSPMYQNISFLGRTEYGAVGRFPMTGYSISDDGFLEYDIYIFSEPVHASKITFYFTLTLDTNPSDPLAYEFIFDDRSYGEIRLIEKPKNIGDLPPKWLEAVQDCVWSETLELQGPIRRGSHLLRIRLCKENMFLENLVLDLGGVKESYLGPPVSRFLDISQGRSN